MKLRTDRSARHLLSDHARLFLLGSLTQGLSEPSTDEELGVHLDLTLTPILRRRLASADWVDLRDLDGEFSTRFRYRLGAEREFTVGGVTLVPYAQAEVFYDTRFGAWNRQLYQAGVELEITKHWRIEPYYAREEDQRSSTAHVDRVGLVLKNLLVALEEHPSVP